MTAESSLIGGRVNRFTHIYQGPEDLIKKVKMTRLLGQRTAACFQRCTTMDTANARHVATFEMDAKLVYSMTNKTPFSKDLALRDQVRKASVSAMANIAEGFERQSNKEFKRFLNIALASTSEVKSHLYVALDQGYIEPCDFDSAYQLCNQISKLIMRFMKYLDKHQSNKQTKQPTTEN